MAFVDRDKELRYLNSVFESATKGNGCVVLVEGAAGIGKTALIDRFVESVKDKCEILRGACGVSSRYSPYDLFSQALRHYGSLENIREEEERRRAKEIVKNLLKTPRMVLIDEKGYGAGRFIYLELRKEIDGVCFTPKNVCEEGDIWLTETTTEESKASPVNIEFTILPRVYDTIREDCMKVIMIDNINYLIYLNGVERVVDFLQNVYSMTSGKHIVIVSGNLDFLTDEERNAIISCFDETITLNLQEQVSDGYAFLVDEIPKKEGIAVFTSRRIVGEHVYQVGAGELDPRRLDFEIFERIATSIRAGFDIGIDAAGILVHYNGVRRVYVWLKAVIDYARKHGKKVYISIHGLGDREIDLFSELVDVVAISRTPSLEDVNVEKQAMKFYDTILNFLLHISSKKPILMILENIQWADKNSLALLQYLARNISDARIMMIVTYRGEDVVTDDGVADVIDKIRGECAEILRLKPLSKEDTAKLVREIWAEGDVDLIYEKSEGNPLFILTLLDYLRNPENRIIPDSIRESVELQLDHLDDRALNFIRFLSCVGDVVPLDLVEDLYPNYSKYIERLENKFILVSDGEIHFIYAPYREIVYRNIPRDLKIEYHCKIAEWMERKERIFDAAYHYYMSRMKKALDYLKMAAERSMEMLALRDAIDYYMKALDIARKYDLKGEMAEIYEHLGEWHMMLGEYEKAIEMFEKSLEYGNKEKARIGRKIGMCYSSLSIYDKAMEILLENLNLAEGMERARILGQIGVVHWRMGNFDDALLNLEEYLKFAKKYDNKVDIAEAYRNIAIVHYMMGHYNDALKYARKALIIANEINNYDKIALAYNVMGAIHNRLNNHAESLKYYKKYLEIAEKIGNLDYIAKGYNNIALAYETIGDVKMAESYYQKTLEILQKVGISKDLSIVYNNIALVKMRRGNYTEGVEMMKKSVEICEKIGDVFGTVWGYINLGSIYTEMMEYDKAREYYERAMNISQKEGYIKEVIYIYLSLAELYREIGDYDKTKMYIDKAHEFMSNTEFTSLKLDYNETYAEYLLAIGKYNEAEKYAEEGLEMATEMNSNSYIMSFKSLLARIKCAKGEYVQAITFFSDLISHYSKLNYKRYLASVYYDYGVCLVDYDKSSALEKLKLSEKLYREMKLQKQAEKVRKKINEILS